MERLVSVVRLTEDNLKANIIQHPPCKCAAEDPCALQCTALLPLRAVKAACTEMSAWKRRSVRIAVRELQPSAQHQDTNPDINLYQRAGIPAVLTSFVVDQLEGRLGTAGYGQFASAAGSACAVRG